MSTVLGNPTTDGWLNGWDAMKRFYFRLPTRAARNRAQRCEPVTGMCEAIPHRTIRPIQPDPYDSDRADDRWGTPVSMWHEIARERGEL